MSEFTKIYYMLRGILQMYLKFVIVFCSDEFSFLIFVLLSVYLIYTIAVQRHIHVQMTLYYNVHINTRTRIQTDIQRLK